MKFSVGDMVVLKQGTPIRRLNVGEVYKVEEVDSSRYMGGYSGHHRAIKIKNEWYREDNFMSVKECKEMKYQNFLITNQSGGHIFKDTIQQAKTYVSGQLKLNPLGVFGVYELSLVGKTKEIPVDWENVELTTTDKL